MSFQKEYADELHWALLEQARDCDLGMDPSDFKYLYRRGWDLCLAIGPDALCDFLWNAWMRLHVSAATEGIAASSVHLSAQTATGIFAHTDNLIKKAYARATPAKQLEVTCLPLTDLWSSFSHAAGRPSRQVRVAWRALSVGVRRCKRSRQL